MYAAIGGMIENELRGDTLVLTPVRDLRELESPEIEVEGKAIRDRLAADPSLRNIIVDFGETDYFGSTAIGMLIQLWQQVRERGGRMVLCRLSAHEEEILQVTGLTRMWPVYLTREVALDALAQ